MASEPWVQAQIHVIENALRSAEEKLTAELTGSRHALQSLEAKSGEMDMVMTNMQNKTVELESNIRTTCAEASRWRSAPPTISETTPPVP